MPSNAFGWRSQEVPFMMRGLWSYQAHQSEFETVQLTSDSFPSASFLSIFMSEYLISEWCSLTLIKILNIAEVLQKQICWRSHGIGKKNHLRNMVKENDTWQFTNCHFWFQRAPLKLAPLIFPSQRFWLTAGSWWKWGNLSSYIFFMSPLSPWEFSSARDKFTVKKKKRKKKYLCHLSLSFHQISWRRSVGGRACAGEEVIKLWVWGNVRHSQTTLMPCAVICQNELWSRILLITFWGKGSHCCLVSLPVSLISHPLFSVCHSTRFERWNQCGKCWLWFTSGIHCASFKKFMLFFTVL